MAIASMLVALLLVSTATDVTMFRANPERTGVFESESITELNELWWMLEVDYPLTSPAISDSLVFVSGQGFLNEMDFSRVYAIHRSRGFVKWWVQLPDDHCTCVATQGGLVFVGCGTMLYAIDPVFAQIRWVFDTAGNVVSSPLVLNGIVYFGSTGGRMYALNTDNGQLLWEYNCGRGVSSSPATDGTYLYFCCVNGRLYSLDLDSGLENWRVDTYIQITSTPAICYGNVYFTGKDGLYCVDGITGEILWSFNVDFYTNSSPAIADSVVYFGDHSHYLYAIDTESGWSIWRFRAEGEDVFSPVIAGDVIYFGDSDGILYALNKDTGEELWRYRVSGTIAYSPTIKDGVIFFCSNTGVMYALR